MWDTLLVASFFLEFGDIFQEPLSVASVWPGWHQCARCVVGTRDRGKGCDMLALPSPKPLSSLSQPAPSCRSAALPPRMSRKKLQERERGRHCPMSASYFGDEVHTVQQWPDIQPWEQIVAPCTYRSFLALNGSPQNNGNYQNYWDQDVRTQICENCFKMIADLIWWVLDNSSIVNK